MSLVGLPSPFLGERDNVGGRDTDFQKQYVLLVPYMSKQAVLSSGSKCEVLGGSLYIHTRSLEAREGLVLISESCLATSP